MVAAKTADPGFAETLRGLRRKFIIITMVLSVAILAVAFATILAIEHNQRMSEVHATLNQATQEQMQLPMGNFFQQFNPAGEGGFSPFGGAIPHVSDDDDDDDDDDVFDRLEDLFEDGLEGKTPGMTGDNGFGSRPDNDRTDFWEQDEEMRLEATNGQIIALASYRMSSSGQVLFTYADTYPLTNEELAQATSALNLAQSPPQASGKLADLGLYYQVQTSGNSWRVAFVPTSYVTGSMLALGSRLAIIGIIALVALFIASLFLSRWALRPVQESWKQQQQFIADASHELKTPLTVILANSSIIKANQDQTVASQRQWLESTETEAHVMQELVEDMLFLAKPADTRNAQEVASRIDFSNLVWEQALQFEAVAFESSITLEEDIADNLFVIGVEKNLRRVVGVLLDNACKYAGEAGKVSISLQRTGDMAQLAINNTGTGIAPEDLPHVFDRFYRADKARVRDKGSFGLGLAIAHEIVTSMNGHISVTSSPAAGTTFTVKLKLA